MSAADRQTRRASLPALAFAVIQVVLATLIAFYVVSVATATFDKARYRAVIAQAVETGELARAHRLPLGEGDPVSIHNFNDCLILSMLILPQDSNPLLRALSPVVPADATPFSGTVEAGYPPYVQCRDLAVAMAYPNVLPTSSYHRYLHGDWVLAKALLAFLPLSVASNGLALVLGLILLTLTALASHKVRSTAGDRPRQKAYLALSLFLFGFSALPVFAWSFSFAPSDIVIAAMLLFFYMRPPSSLSDRQFVVASALFGALTALFEFLTGAAPAGLMAIIAILAFDHAGSSRQMMRRLVLGAGAFGGAIILSFALKMAVVGMVWGPSELDLFGRQIGAHMSAGGWDIAPENASKLDRLGVSVEAIRQSMLLSYAYAVSKIVYFTQLMAFGSVALGALLTVLAPLGLGLLAIWQLLRSRAPVERLRIAVILLGCLVMPAWYAAFIHHTIIHAHFMFRPMVWPLALLVALQAWRGQSLRRSGIGRHA